MGRGSLDGIQEQGKQSQSVPFISLKYCIHTHILSMSIAEKLGIFFCLAYKFSPNSGKLQQCCIQMRLYQKNKMSLYARLSLIKYS